MKIKFDLIKKNPYSRPGIGNIIPKGIVIHWVGNPGTSAEANRRYFEGLSEQKINDPDAKYRYASSHYIIDKDEVIQCIPTREMAYHVGSHVYMEGILDKLSSYPNNCTVGIELCHPDWTGKFEEEVLEKAKEVVLMLCENYDLTEDNLYRHYDVTGKRCPKDFVDHEEAWDDFKASVRRKLEYKKDNTHCRCTP